MEQDKCQICNTAKFKYTCPKCNLLYCSVGCYKSAEHLKCSEQFYKSCIEEDLTTSAPNSKEDMQKMYEILKRIRQADAGMEPGELDDFLDKEDNEKIDSDDDQPAGDHEEDEFDEDIADRLQGVNLDDADEVWDRLTAEERNEFKELIAKGDISKLLPNFKPWWEITKDNSKIVEIPAKSNTATVEKNDVIESQMPKIAENIPSFQSICKKEPSPCIHYNLWNILAAYSCVVRFFSGEHITNPSEAVSHLVNLSVTLKQGTNFEDADDAIVSVEMEDLTTASMSGAKVQIVESREKLQADSRQLMSSRINKLASLSDILKIVRLAKNEAKNKPKEQAEFQKLFAMCSGSVQLDRTKLQQLVKRLEFLLAYVEKD